MSAPRVRSDYDQLKAIATTFKAHSEAVAQTNQDLRSHMEVLQGGDWIGEAATKFYQEMNDQVMPAMVRLQTALAEASNASQKISQTMKDAEQAAAGVLRHA